MALLRVEFRAMGTRNEIVLECDDEARARRAGEAARDEVLRIEAKYSRYRDDSVVGAINRAAGRGAVAIDAETAALLAFADRCHAQSRGRFDLTSGVLRHAWDFRARPAAVPAQAAIDALLARVGWGRVEWTATSIRLEPGMELDLGGIGKEYAADRAATVALDLLCPHGFVNLGGDVRIIGPHADGTAWRIGIADPRPPADEPDRAFACVDLAAGALATSGDAERFVEIDGRRYAHVIDARTGWPVDRWRSISVAAPLCTVAGSCATIALLLGEEAPAFLAREDVAWIGVEADGSVRGTLATRPGDPRRTGPH